MKYPTRKEESWMRICESAGEEMRRCSRRAYFAVILDRKGHLIGQGWNGAPPGMTNCIDGGCPRGKGDVATPGAQYDNCVAQHAEQGALLHSDYTARRDGATLIVNGIPCFTCAKLIACSGVNRVVYKYDGLYEDWTRTESFLWDAGIDTVRINA